MNRFQWQDGDLEIETLATDEAMMTAALDAAGEDDEELSGDAAIMAAALDAADDDEPIQDSEPEEVAPDVFAMDEGQFDESKHKRDAGGQFSSTGGGGGATKPDDGKSTAIAKVFATKKEHIAHLLTNGVTPKELMQAMSWPSVSMPAQAKSLKMKLEKKDGKYYGTPMSEAEIKAAKEEETGKKTDAEAQQILKNAGLHAGAGKFAPAKPAPSSSGYTPPKDYEQFLDHMATFAKAKDTKSAADLMKYNPAWAETFSKSLTPSAKAGLEALAGQPAPKLVGPEPKPKPAASKAPATPTATAEELKKAQKSTALPLSSSDPDAAATIKAFNDKYAGKNSLSPAQLNQKVADHKTVLATVKQKESDAQKAAAEKAAKALAKKDKELQAKFDADPELKLHYEAMQAMFGGGKATAKYVANAKSKVESAGLSKVIRAEDAVPIIAYSGSHYMQVNDQLRSGKMTKDQYAFSKSLNAGLDKLPSFTSPTYRKASLTPEQAALYEPGHIIEERGFMSTSKNAGTWAGSHTFEVKGKNGKDIQKLSSHPSEAEVLFKSGSRFEVLSKSGSHIVLQEV